ncbi:FAD-binding oxidoreductase [Nocardiopsis sp. MG754419]|nr:FAD-binding oxidoreductase [Nocardiopsis sp. MG754419]
MGARLRLDTTTRGAYTSDASLYRRFPAAVLEPQDTDDVRAGIELARLRGWPVVGRGGGTSVAGNAIGEGLIIDTSRRMNRVLEVDPVARTARVQPGVVCDQLKEAAAAHGLTYGPDPSTHSRCTIGGMVSNNACGSHSVAWGTSASNLVAVTSVLADGREVRSERGGADDEGVDTALRGLRDRHLAMLRLELGRFPRQVSGYGLHYLLPEHGFDVAKAVAGSEGTLGVITELTVSLVELPEATALAVLAFPTVFDAAAVAPRLRQDGVATIEGMGGDLLTALRAQPGKERAGSGLPGGAPGDVTAGGWLYCETSGRTVEEAEARARGLVAEAGTLVASTVVTDRTEARALWRIREAGAGIVTRLPDGGEAWPGWEDSAVPAENLADYLRDLYRLLDSHGLQGIPFGHFGEGCVHIRVSYPLREEGGDRVFRAFMEGAADLVAAHGGSLSGEHGDGRARSELLTRMYSPQMLAAFRSFKEVFDPDGLFNPGVLVDPDPVDQGLRPGPEQRRFELTPVHALSRDEGSLVNAVNRCVGVGSCRSQEGAMCPSFQVTGDEVHSTRGRARLLSEMLRGERITGGHRSEEVREALDLCLSCKACASECPVNVDMATYKAEFLHRHYEGRVRPPAHYSMGWLPLLTSLLHRVPGAARALNVLLRIPVLERSAKAVAGIDRSRGMIRFAPRSLRAEFRRRRASTTVPDQERSPRSGAEGGRDRPRLVLWPDSFSDHLDTGPGLAAVEVLEALGYEVLMPREFVCCGLTWHSTGQLTMVRRVLRRTVEVMAPYVEEGIPVVGLEPSCREMLAHELTELLPDDPRAARLQEAVVPFSDVVAAHLPRDGEDPARWPFATLDVGAIAQVHCHERARGDSGSSSSLLAAVGVDERSIRTGCCGLAGNWGFEPGHADLSRNLGERELFPAIRARADGDIVLADGFSCRTQVRQETDAEPLHLAQVLRRALREGT